MKINLKNDNIIVKWKQTNETKENKQKRSATNEKEKIYNSNSWKITKPMRWIGKKEEKVNEHSLNNHHAPDTMLSVLCLHSCISIYE